MEPKQKAILQMLLCAALWSTAGIFIKLNPWPSLAIAGWRSAVALGVVLVYFKVGRVPFRISKRAALNGAAMCLTFLAFVTANKLTTAANAIVLQFTAPVFLMVFSAVRFGSKFRRGDLLAVAATLGGISLFFFDQLQPGYLLGNCVAIGAGACMAVMYLTIGSVDEETRMGGMLLGHLFTAVIGVTASFWLVEEVTGAAVLSVLGLGVIQLGIPYILLALSAKHCPPLACSLLGAVEPLLNPVWVAIFDGERPGPFALVGGGVVVVAVVVWCLWSERQSRAKGMAAAAAE